MHTCVVLESLGDPLEQFVLSSFEKVLLVRTERRLGLIRARIFGVECAHGRTLTFLDSHCECVPGKRTALIA